MGTRKQHFTVRLRPETIADLERLAKRDSMTKSALADRYIEEGIRMAKHPGIVFRDSPTGRIPAFPGRHLAVWDTIETVQHNNGDADAAAEYLGIHPSFVQAALSYYADYEQEIDDWIEENAGLSAELEKAWRRTQTVGSEQREARAG